MLDGLIEFKKKVLDCTLNCRMFTTNYPSLIEHIIDEAKLYREYIRKIESDEDIDKDEVKKMSYFGMKL